MVDSPLGDYLRARRAGLRPEDVGIRSISSRRVEGLRRDEVAQLAGISPEYYLRLEQGRGHQPSHQVLRSLARALRLEDGAVLYMARLIRIESGEPPREDPPLAAMTESSLGKMMGQWKSTPAYLTDRNQKMILCNDLAKSILPGSLRDGANLVLQVFGTEWRSQDRDWEATAQGVVATLRFYGDPGDPAFRDLVGLLSMRDPDFRRIWATHDASESGGGQLQLDVAGVGHVDFTQQRLRLAGDENHLLTVLHARPGSVAAEVIRSLTGAEAVDVSLSARDGQETA